MKSNASGNDKEINFWSQRGIATPDIIHRIHERKDDECLTAYEWMFSWFGRETADHIIGMGDGLRSTEKAMNILTPLFDEQKIPDDKKALMMELAALAIECTVRASKQCFPSTN